MSICVQNKNKVSNIFVNVNGEKKKVVSCWANKDDIPIKVFQISNQEVDLYEYAPASAYSNWNYTLDDENDTIFLNYYVGSETDIIVYANYPIGTKMYTTKLLDSYGYNIFNNNKSTLQSAKFSKHINTSNVINMNRMFYGCTSLTNLDISGFDTSNVTDTSQMFYGCTSLTNLDISNFDTSNVTNMNSMFSGCTSLTNLDISNFDTSNVTNMNYMFANCKIINYLDVSSFYTNNVTSMYGMFSGCYALISLNLNNFDTSNVTNMTGMFSSCYALDSLDLSNFNTKKVTSMDTMFYNCTNLKIIYVTNGNWVMPSSSANCKNMFTGCGCSSVTFK